MSDPVTRLAALEPLSRSLEPDVPARGAVENAARELAAEFIASLSSGAPTYGADASAARELRDLGLSEGPSGAEQTLEVFSRSVLGSGINPAAGGMLGYIPGGGLHAAAVGDYLAAVSNRYAGMRFASPGAVEMEELLLEWMARLIGLPTASGGNLTSGGSIANLIAVVTARDAAGLHGADYARAVVYTTELAHHSVDKALTVAGLREAPRRRIAVDERYRMIPERLAEAIARDRAAGLRPWLLVASAGTTDVGSIDPLADVASIAEQNELWFHVDAAYGGFFALVDECRPLLAGIERAASVVLDPHKGLFLPYGTGAVLVRDRAAMYRAHHHTAAYMQDATDEEIPDAPSPAELSPELTKHFRGLRLWLPLRLHGLAAFRACLEEKLWLTRYFHARVQQLGFTVGPKPELSVSLYRFVPPSGDANDFNRQLVAAVQRDGRVFVSSTTLGGTVWLRLAVLAFRTHREHIDTLLTVLEEQVTSLAK